MSASATLYRRASLGALALLLLCAATRAAVAQGVVATVPVGSNPAGADVNTATNKIYVVNSTDSSVSVIDGVTNTVTKTITGVGTQPTDIAVNSATNKIYVAGGTANGAVVIDGATDTVLTTVPTGNYAFRISVNSVTNRVYVSSAGLNGAVTVIDGSTDTVITNVPMPSGNAYASAVNTATNKVYVCDAVNNVVNVVNGATNAFAVTIPVGNSPQKIAVNPVTNRVYVANYVSMNVTVIDGATDAVVTTVPTSGNPYGVGVDTAHNKIFVANQANAPGTTADPVDVINGASNTISTTFNAGDQPSDVAVNSATRRAYVTHETTSGAVSVVSIQSELLISELRTRALGNTQNDYIELYNNTDAPLTVATSDGSTGWAITSLATGGGSITVHATITNGTVIPARSHYLVASSPFIGGYALTGYAVPDGAMIPPDVPDNTGVAVFRTSNPSNFNLANRLDAVGFNSGLTGPTADLFHESTPLPAISNSDAEHAFVRRLDTAGRPVDTETNANDFLFVSTNGATQGGVNSILGAPGPEARNSPVRRTFAQVSEAVIDPAQPSSAPPNRVRNLTPVTNGANGTLSIRRRFTNNTAAPITRLRFRIRDITTFNSPNQFGGAQQADLRALDSSDVVVTVTGGGMTTVRGLTLEQPPSQPNGGGINSSLAVGFITMGAPLAPGASVDVGFLFGVQQTGKFVVFITIEALP